MSQDTQLQLAVLAELDWDPSVAAGHIGVSINAGVVALIGQVDSFAEKRAAEIAARPFKGVLAVAEEIEVQLPFERKRGDEQIAGAIAHRLAWDVSVPLDSVQVQVERGWVTLTGEVDWHYQKKAAEQDVRRLYGVVSVSNQVSIKPGVSTANISNDIDRALRRSWFSSPEPILVTAVGGKVRLIGSVKSWQAHQAAAEAAWGAPGTIDVENLLAVI
jgi:osmotically-inducible protein OsmY